MSIADKIYIEAFNSDNFLEYLDEQEQDIDRTYDWDNERSIYIFSDHSAIVADMFNMRVIEEYIK